MDSLLRKYIDIIELKKESIDIDNEVTKKAMIYKDYRSILFIFKLYYKNKTSTISQYPIKMKSKRVFEYYKKVFRKLISEIK